MTEVTVCHERRATVGTRTARLLFSAAEWTNGPSAEQESINAEAFAATEAAAEKGLENTSPKNGSKLVAEWVTELEQTDITGAKGLHGNLVRLQKELDKDEPNSDRVTKILGKLGPATLKLADKCEDEKVAEKVRSLGEALSASGQEGDEGEED